MILMVQTLLDLKYSGFVLQYWSIKHIPNKNMIELDSNLTITPVLILENLKLFVKKLIIYFLSIFNYY